jgi:hypothetical protein
VGVQIQESERISSNDSDALYRSAKDCDSELCFKLSCEDRNLEVCRTGVLTCDNLLSSKMLYVLPVGLTVFP